MTRQPLRITFMGTPDFAVPSLRALAEASDVANVTAVYTQPDRPAGRGQKLTKPPIKILAEELGIPVYQPENVNDPSEKQKFAHQMPELVVVAAYAQFLSQAILNTPRLGCINVHSSLLPKYRGAAPIQYAIWNGDRESGVTIMKLVQKMDAGNILSQRSVPIGLGMTADELHDELSIVGAKLLVETVRALQENRSEERVQDESLVTYAKLIKKSDGAIDWTKSGEEIQRQVRALCSWPGTFSRSTRGVIKVHSVRFYKEVQGAPNGATPGDTFIPPSNSHLWVRCSDGWLDLLEIQLEGKKKMRASELLNGLRGEWNFQ